MKSVVPLLITLLFFVHPDKLLAQDQWVLDSTLVYVDSVSGQMDAPWELVWGPDSLIWLTDLEYIKRLDPETGELDTVLYKPGDNGLGMDIHWDFVNQPYVFIVFDTGAYYAQSGQAALYRYEYSNGQLINELELIRYTHYGEHSGARVIVAQDGKVLLTTADYTFGGDSLMGRTLRLNIDGSIPVDNPDPTSYEWTSGHRDPQGLLQLPNGKVYNSEHGQGCNDEINLLEAGNHYGWPAYDGNTCFVLAPDSCTSSTYSYTKALNLACKPPSGIDYYDHPDIPEFEGCILVSILNGSSIDAARLSLSGDSVISYFSYLSALGYYGRVRDVCVAPDGSVYFIGGDRTQGTTIYRVYNPKLPTGKISAGKPLFNLFPNPASSQVKLTASAGLIPGLELTLYDLAGRLVMTTAVLSTPIDIAKLQCGTYLYMLWVNDEILKTEKLIIQH